MNRNDTDSITPLSEETLNFFNFEYDFTLHEFITLGFTNALFSEDKDQITNAINDLLSYLLSNENDGLIKKFIDNARKKYVKDEHDLTSGINDIHLRKYIDYLIPTYTKLHEQYCPLLLKKLKILNQELEFLGFNSSLFKQNNLNYRKTLATSILDKKKHPQFKTFIAEANRQFPNAKIEDDFEKQSESVVKMITLVSEKCEKENASLNSTHTINNRIFEKQIQRDDPPHMPDSEPPMQQIRENSETVFRRSSPDNEFFTQRNQTGYASTQLFNPIMLPPIPIPINENGIQLMNIPFPIITSPSNPDRLSKIAPLKIMLKPDREQINDGMIMDKPMHAQLALSLDSSSVKGDSRSDKTDLKTSKKKSKRRKKNKQP